MTTTPPDQQSAEGGLKMAAKHMEAQLQDRVVAWLDRAMARDLPQHDCGRCGCRSAREVAEALGADKKDVRAVLSQAAESGLIRRVEASNGVWWRSTRPLPWEPGGDMHARWQADAEAKKAPKVLIVQACTPTGCRDDKAYPLAWRDRAEAYVSLQNAQSAARRENDRSYGRCGGWPTYRLVQLLEPAEDLAAIRQAEG